MAMAPARKRVENLRSLKSALDMSVSVLEQQINH